MLFQVVNRIGYTSHHFKLVHWYIPETNETSLINVCFSVWLIALVCPWMLLQWRAEEKQRMEEENRRILQFAQEQQAREQDRQQRQRQREEAMARVQMNVSNFICL